MTLAVIHLSVKVAAGQRWCLTDASLGLRDDLLRQAGTLGGIVNPGSNQTVFQATVPDNALRAGLAQIPRGQACPSLVCELRSAHA